MTIDTILPRPDIFDAKRVLCIQPHYDDNDIGVGGTLALLQENGAELFYLTATDDLMGVVDHLLSDEEAAQTLKRDQLAAGEIIGVKEQYWCGYPDAGNYDYFALRRDFLKYIRLIQPDFVVTVDPWLTYEAHHDHIQTGLAAAEAVMFAGLTKSPPATRQWIRPTNPMASKELFSITLVNQTRSWMCPQPGRQNLRLCNVTRHSSRHRK